MEQNLGIIVNICEYTNQAHGYGNSTSENGNFTGMNMEIKLVVMKFLLWKIWINLMKWELNKWN